MIEGLVAGATVVWQFAIQGSGEPTVTMQPQDDAIGFTVLSVFGLVSAGVMYGINAAMTRS